jgi:DNA-binding beta-propeller fold protein YncE
LDPTGQFAYVPNEGGGVSAYVIKRRGGLLPLGGSPFPAGSIPLSMTVDPAGQFAYVTNGGSGNVSAYSANGITGALTPVAGSPFQAGSVPTSVTTTAGPPPAVP